MSNIVDVYTRIKKVSPAFSTNIYVEKEDDGMNYVKRVLPYIVFCVIIVAAVNLVLAATDNFDCEQAIDGEKSITVTIDRIEEGIAVLLVHSDDIITMKWPVGLLPKNCSEGYVLRINVEIDSDATYEAGKRINKLYKGLLKQL